MVKQNLPVRGVLQKEAREVKALGFLHDMLLPISGVVDADGVELYVRVKSVFVR